MSIVPLKKATFVGTTEDKEKVLADLQDMGCLEIIPLKDQAVGNDDKPSPRARDSLRFLLDCPQRRRQIKDPARFCVEEVEERAASLQKDLFELNDEKDFLNARLESLKLWGEFTFPALEEVEGFRLWFYVIPHKEMPGFLDRPSMCWQLIQRDQRSCYIVVISKEEPMDMPVDRVHLGCRSRSQIEERIDEIEFAIEDLQAERAHLTRWCYLFARNLDRLEDAAARVHVAGKTLDQDPVFALQAWAPTQSVQELQAYCSKEGIVFESTDPEPSDNPPTLMRNPEETTAGEGLVTFYMTPGYRSWDPSNIVFWSFTAFFAMILADAGYAAIIGLGLIYFWKKMSVSRKAKQWRNLLFMIFNASLIYGVMVGSYFGVAPREGSFLKRFQILDINDSKTMMMISVFIGVFHICLGAVMDGWRYGRSQRALPSYGWAILVAGGLALSIGSSVESQRLKILGGALMSVGVALIVIFSGVGQKPLARIVTGVMGLTRITSAFGDVLSYLRLFALGLASASLAMAFNGMAKQIHEAVPGAGLFFAILVLLMGHTLNLLLGISSGVIHGMRLNLIEFFNWSLKEEGKIFRPFQRKEGV